MQAPLQAKNDSNAAKADVARTVAQKRVFADNGQEAMAQHQLAEMMNNSPRVLQQRALSDAIHNSTRMVAQRHEMNVLFGGAVRPQGDGTVLAELSPAQREEKPNNTGLPNQLKSGIESLSGMSMDHVKVHYNSDKPAQLQADAYAQGSEVHVGPGQERHLPHEAWHVVQQAQGLVKATTNANGGVSVNVDAALEAEADVMGSKALRSNAGNSIENIQLAAHAHAALPSCAVAQLYARAAYAPNLADLVVPGGGGAAYNVATFARPAGWYEGTHDALFARAVDDRRVEENRRLAITLVQCESAGSWHNVNDMQIGHIENWQTYLTFVGPQTIREATDAYNDMNNLRFEGPTANTSRDFENGRESEDEDDSSDDDFIDKSDGGKMHPDARRGLDEYKASQSQYHSLKAGR
jgi:hypothetical protein